MQVTEKINALRKIMGDSNIDAYIIVTDDYHGSEYVGDYFKEREYMSGFTGSAGTLLVMTDFAGLWTDGRYFLQAACPQSAPPSPCRPLFHKAQPQWIGGDFSRLFIGHAIAADKICGCIPLVGRQVHPLHINTISHCFAVLHPCGNLGVALPFLLRHTPDGLALVVC